MKVNGVKLALARAFDAIRLSEALVAAQRLALGPHIRALNYHAVPAEHASSFEAQLRYYAKHFSSVDYDDLMALREGRWNKDKPGVLLTFDDGLVSHARVVAPLLERYGFTGWFFVPAGLLGDGTPRRDPQFTEDSLTWDEARRLAERHVVGCHTMSHKRLGATLTDGDLRREITDAKQRLEGQLGREVPVFCWVGGEEASYSERAARLIREAGFRVSFMTNNFVIRPGCDLLQLQRTNIEAWFPMSVVRFQLSGFLDVTYSGKRRRVNRLTAT